MENEKMKILEMIQNGKINAEEGAELLSALEENNASNRSITKNTGDRFLRVRVTGDKVKKVNVNLPLSMLKVASKFMTMSLGFMPQEARDEMARKGIDISNLDFVELMRLIDEGLVDGKIVDIDVDDPKEGKVQVEIYVD
jgi:hypothetical protein